MNLCPLSKGIFPDILKVRKITPIYKNDNPKLLENYRPVSTLNFWKIFEKVIHEPLYSFMVSQTFNESLPIWFSERSFNQPCANLFYVVCYSLKL